MVIRAHGGFYYARTRAGKVTCRLRGTLKQAPWESDLIAVGDRVQIMLTKPGKGVIEEILPRESALSRQAPLPKGKRPIGWTEREQVLVANPDQAVFVFAVREPDPNLRMLDRFLVAAERAEIDALICANKIDLLDGEEDPRYVFGLYEEISYPVLYTSALTGEGVNGLREWLRGKLSVLAGPSGAGKSSLLNAMQPGLGLKVRELSLAVGKGRHTTIVPELLELEVGGYVADTPGLRSFALWDIVPEELEGLYPEVARFAADCRYPGCSHLHEPGCAVMAAVERGEIHPERYDSYCLLYEDLASTDWWE
ncbi:MAG: ribosome small subunit-dependent GTPase A [Anaerolineae bacterium]|nr:MAG: ribosome small subunit-dependent GTPase A [Anaerolineae bacterium]